MTLPRGHLNAAKLAPRVSVPAPTDFPHSPIRSLTVYFSITPVSTVTEGPSKKAVRRKTLTKRPLDDASLCPFKFTIALHPTQNHWYLYACRLGSECNCSHLHHQHTPPEHSTIDTKYLSKETTELLSAMFTQRVNPSQAAAISNALYGVNCTPKQVQNLFHSEFMKQFEKGDGLSYSASSADKLIKVLQNRYGRRCFPLSVVNGILSTNPIVSPLLVHVSTTIQE